MLIRFIVISDSMVVFPEAGLGYILVNSRAVSEMPIVAKSKEVEYFYVMIVLNECDNPAIIYN